MSNEIGTTLLNTLTKSTFDIGNMAKVMAEADVAGPRAIVEKQQEKTNTELNALTYLETNLTAFQTYLGELSTPDIFNNKTATSSDENVVGVQVSGTAVSGSYQIQSMQLAQAHTLVANKSFSSTADTLSTGTLSISVGGAVQNIVIDNTNNTLDGLQKIINSGDYGVNASIVNNGGAYQLMFSAKETGAASEISISGIADFDVDGLTTTAEAQDAVMNINGLNVTSSTNNFSGVISGLDINLKSVSASAQTINIGTDSAKITETVTSFVDVYNQLDTIFDELNSYEELSEAEEASGEYEFHGDLAGSSLLRTLKEQVRSSLSGAIGELSDPNTLAAVGISFDREGQMSLDSTVLDNLIENNLDALSLVFAKGGSASDPLINVLGSSDRTQAGDFTIDITQVAERASVAGAAITYAANEYRSAGDKALDPTLALTLEAGASMDVSLNGAAAVNVNFTAGSFATKDALAAQMQTDINNALGSSLLVNYDSTQSRFEITSAEGTVDLSNIISLSNQGFNQTSYSSDQLIDLTAGASFDVSVDASTAATVNLGAEKYTLSELANRMQSSINGLTELTTSGSRVSVTTDGGVLNVSSDRFGNSSDVTLTAMTNLANAGLTADLTDAGLSVDGTITTASGALSLGAYVDSTDGRKVKISDFAVIAGNDAEVRGLEFEVLGGVTGARGNITFTQGFASRLDETINNLLDNEYGLVSERIESLNKTLERYDEKTDKLDARYDKMLLKYQIQFSTLQSLLSSTEQTSSFLTATFSNENN